MPSTAFDALIRSDLPLPRRREGKVRDIYDLPARNGSDAGLLLVASDRVSAFDVVMPTPITGKGRILTGVAMEWFRFIERRGLARHHVVSDQWQALCAGPGAVLPEDLARPLAGRVMLCRPCRVLPVECVARGYLDGSGWAEYSQRGAVCGVALPAGLRRGDRLPGPIFTPATKEAVGVHDVNIDFDRASEVAHAWLKEQGLTALGSGREFMTALRRTTIGLYEAAHEFAATRGLLLADTKFEFGVSPEGDVLLVDEALTPDSSRYWDASLWKPGGEQPSFDKQFLREYLNGLTARGQWDKQAPGPALPDEVVRGTAQRYEEVQRRLWGNG